MAVAAKERDISDMMRALVIVDDRGGKHKRGCVDSQDSFNSSGRPVGDDAFSRLRERLKDRADQKHRDDRIKKETLRVAASVHCEGPRRPMNRAELPPPVRPPQMPVRFFHCPPVRPTTFVPPSSMRENFEAEVDAGIPFLSMLQDAPPQAPVADHAQELQKKAQQEQKKLVMSIIERQVKESLPDSPKVCDFGSQNAFAVSSGSLDAVADPFSPQQSSGSSPLSLSFPQQSWSSYATDFPAGNDPNAFDDFSS